MYTLGTGSDTFFMGIFFFISQPKTKNIGGKKNFEKEHYR